MKNKHVELSLISNEDNADPAIEESMLALSLPGDGSKNSLWAFIDTEDKGYGIGFREGGLILTTGADSKYISIEQVFELISNESEIVSMKSVENLVKKADSINAELEALDCILDRLPNKDDPDCSLHQ